MIFYLLSEESTLDSDSLRNNKKLEKIIKLRIKYKLKLFILLTHSDTYCNKVKNTEKDWEISCETALNNNKNSLLNYLNKLIIEDNKSDFIMTENDIFYFDESVERNIKGM